MAFQSDNALKSAIEAQRLALEKQAIAEAKYAQQLQYMQMQNSQNAYGQVASNNSAQTASNGLLGMASGLGMFDPAIFQKLISGMASGVSSVKPPSIDAKAIEALKAAEPRRITQRMPDSVSLITAWRAWSIVLEGSEYRLKALGQSAVWQPKKKLEAFCTKGGSQHPAPHFSCECGIWCFKSLEQLLPALEGYTVPVLGCVSIWGRIIESDRGFRAQYAYPKELWLMDKSQEQLGYIYGVPVRTA